MSGRRRRAGRRNLLAETGEERLPQWVPDRLRFLAGLAAAAGIYYRRLAPFETAPRAAVLAEQARRLDDLLAHACRTSCFYRRHWGVPAGAPAPRAADLARLPPVTKALLMERFDDVVTDPRLGRGGVRAELERRAMPGQAGGALADYRLVVTSGTTGEPAVFPYHRAEWAEGMALIVRSASFALGGRGRTGALALVREALARPRVAGVATQHPMHVSTQLTSSFSGGGVRGLRLAASVQLADQVAALNAYAPHIVGGYPSILALLAGEQLSGRLSIRPRLVFSGGETVTAGTRRRVREAWGCDLFDFYGLTETLIIAGECAAHAGLHVYEDAAVIEVVNEKGAPVPAGEMGAGLLVTNLFNRTLPLIRYEVSDLAAMKLEPCACGLPFARLVNLAGRREEILELTAPDGRSVSVHPFVIETPLEEERAVRAFAIRRENGTLRIRVEPAPGVDAAMLARRLEAAVRAALAPFGLEAADVKVEIVAGAALERTATGKRRRVT
jgi:phenylacetate-coenzyme A ligase PaaK-like adenylate-forming protein